MNFYSTKELKKIGFKSLGKNLEISKNVNFYNFNGLIGTNSVISASVKSNSLVYNKNLHEVTILPIRKKINFSKIKF